METIGRWGITRDGDGKLAYINSWPWYWRYPVMLAGMACLLACFVYLESETHQKQTALTLTFCGLAAVWFLSITYELFGLLLVVAVFWGGSKLLGAVFPESWKPVTHEEVEEIRVTATDAYALAEQANAAIGSGADSDTAMGEEIQEARAEAAEANATAAEAQAQVAALESRLEAVCYKAPALCQ